MTRGPISIGFAFAACIAASSASGQMSFVQRVRTVDYSPGAVIRAEGTPGYQLAIEFAPDERIENIAVGDSGAWQATPNKRGDRLFVKTLRAGASTNMVVITDAREYLFDLVSVPEPTQQLAYVLRFRFPSAPSLSGPPAAPNSSTGVVGRYHLTGDRKLRPNAMEDDGVHTYLQWPQNVGLPAIYAVDALGRETLVNGMVRGNMFVIDSVSEALVFRLDRRVAKASRLRGTRP